MVAAVVQRSRARRRPPLLCRVLGSAPLQLVLALAHAFAELGRVYVHGHLAVAKPLWGVSPRRTRRGRPRGLWRGCTGTESLDRGIGPHRAVALPVPYRWDRISLRVGITYCINHTLTPIHQSMFAHVTICTTHIALGDLF